MQSKYVYLVGASLAALSMVVLALQRKFNSECNENFVDFLFEIDTVSIF